MRDFWFEKNNEYMPYEGVIIWPYNVYKLWHSIGSNNFKRPQVVIGYENMFGYYQVKNTKRRLQ
jgi:hypothetical protein